MPKTPSADALFDFGVDMTFPTLQVQTEVEPEAASPKEDDANGLNDDIWAEDDPQEDDSNCSTGREVIQGVPGPDKRLYAVHSNAGYRIGLETARAKVAQPGFDRGYTIGMEIGERVGELVGILVSALAVIREGEASVDDSSENADSVAASEVKKKIEGEWEKLVIDLWDEFGQIDKIVKNIGLDDDITRTSAVASEQTEMPTCRSTDDVLTGYSQLQAWITRADDLFARLGLRDLESNGEECLTA